MNYHYLSHPTPENIAQLPADSGICIPVQMSKDSCPMLYDSEKYDESYQIGAGYLRDYTADQLRYPANHLPIIYSLKELLPLLDHHPLLLLIKTDVIQYEGLERRTVDVLRSYARADGTAFATSSPLSLHRLRAEDKHAVLIKLCRPSLIDPVNFALIHDVYGLLLDHVNLTQSQRARCLEHHLQCYQLTDQLISQLPSESE